MDSLGDVLSKFTIEEPDEIRALKQYIADEFGYTARIGLQGEETLVITVKSPALANTLRLRLPTLRAVAATQKRLIFRIG